MHNLWDLRTPMRDGVELSSDLYLPPEGLDGGPYPVVLMRTPYSNQQATYVRYARHLAKHGYAVAIQDVRGRHDSAGSFYPFRDEGPDGYDSIEWLARQDWCTGKIGMMGGSYAGWVQWAAARERPPHLTTLVSAAAAGRWNEELPYRNGIVMLVMFGWLHSVAARVQQTGADVDWERVLRHLPLRTMDHALGRELPVWQDWLDHHTLDAYWQQMRLTAEDFAGIDVPVLHITGWYDGDQPGALFFYEGMRTHSPAASKQFITIGPWNHGGTRTPRQTMGGVDFGPTAVEDLDDAHLRWFDYWLKGTRNGQATAKRARYFVTGTNEWHEAGRWPPPRTTPTRYFLHSDGHANSLSGDGVLSDAKPGEEPSDSYSYDPTDPVVVVTDLNFYPDPGAQGVDTPLDRRWIERREDVLVYTSAPIDQPIEVVGKPRVELLAGSDCPDTDWFVHLSDVAPSGASIALADGILRARFRDSLERETFMAPGEVYRFAIELMLVGHTFKPGHRMRISITSSHFPIWSRNLNTGGPIAEETIPRIASNRVFHDRTHASHVVLPVAR